MEESDSDDEFRNVCPICDRRFETLAGVKQHFSRGHTDTEVQSFIENKSQTPPTSATAPQRSSTDSANAPQRSSTDNQNSSSDALRNRSTCTVCGFIAKNERGLKGHSIRMHGTHTTTSSQPIPPPQIDIDLSDEPNLIRKFGELLYKCKCSIPLVRIIQKSVRTVVCQELAKVTEFAAKNNNIFAWFRLLSFPHIVLNTIARTNTKDSRRINVIRHNLAVFSKLNDVPSLFNELLQLLSIDRPKKPESRSDKLLIKIAQRKIGEGDISGAVRVLCSQEGIADYNDGTINKLKAKHPAEESIIAEEEIADLDNVETSNEEIVNAIKHFPVSSSGGIDGLRPRHLKDLISFSCGDAAEKLISASSKLVNVVRSGKICSDLLPVFYGAALIALAKKNGDIRPIAIGLTWRRLAGKIACFNIKDELSQRFSPTQNGFGIKGGAEAIVHAVRAFAEAHHPNPMAILKFDYRNAFNELFRKFLLGEVKKEAETLSTKFC